MFFNYKAVVAAVASSALLGSVLAYQGDITYYTPGLGACGANSVSTDYVVALSTEEYDGGAHCFQHLTVYYGSASVDVTVVDECEGCAQYDLDLSPSAFEQLAPLSAGRISAGWAWDS